MQIPKHKKIVMVHCLATQDDWADGKTVGWIVKEVRKWHKARGWSDIGYAAILSRMGIRGLGRDLDKDGDVWEETGAGARGWNKDGIHIALDGGFGSNADDMFLDNYTRKQEIGLIKLLREIEKASGRELVAVRDPKQARALGADKLALMGHNQVAAKACPGFNVADWWDGQPARTTSSPAAPKFNLMALLKAIFGGRI